MIAAFAGDEAEEFEAERFEAESSRAGVRGRMGGT